MAIIETPRLRIVPITRAIALAALHDGAELARLLNVTVPDGWPGPDLRDFLPAFAEQLATEPWRAEWVRLAVGRAERAVIGDMGFHGPPDAGGTVELGYSVLPAHRRRGYASEGARALIEWAFDQPTARRIIATCSVDNPGSIRTLEGAGLRRLDEEWGMIRWEVRREER